MSKLTINIKKVDPFDGFEFYIIFNNRVLGEGSYCYSSNELFIVDFDNDEESCFINVLPCEILEVVDQCLYYGN